MALTERETLSIIIPCYNEEAGIPHLQEQLQPALEKLEQKYNLQLVFVDDGSKDKTNELLQQYFGNRKDTLIVKHEQNRNLGAAIKTGIKHSSGDFVAMLDSDCTYNPHYILEMLSLLDKDTDIVTVSPLHPKGKIIGVQKYRILLSRSVSNIYRALLGSGLYTHTAMVRVYRKPVLDNITFRYDNFLAVTEIMAKAVLHGHAVKEYPCSIEVRKYGSSKMKIMSIILSHLNFIRKIILHKTIHTDI